MFLVRIIYFYLIYSDNIQLYQYFSPLYLEFPTFLYLYAHNLNLLRWVYYNKGREDDLMNQMCLSLCMPAIYPTLGVIGIVAGGLVYFAYLANPLVLGFAAPENIATTIFSYGLMIAYSIIIAVMAVIILFTGFFIEGYYQKLHRSDPLAREQIMAALKSIALLANLPLLFHIFIWQYGQGWYWPLLAHILYLLILDFINLFLYYFHYSLLYFDTIALLTERNPLYEE